MALVLFYAVVDRHVFIEKYELDWKSIGESTLFPKPILTFYFIVFLKKDGKTCLGRCPTFLAVCIWVQYF